MGNSKSSSGGWETAIAYPFKNNGSFVKGVWIGRRTTNGNSVTFSTNSSDASEKDVTITQGGASGGSAGARSVACNCNNVLQGTGTYIFKVTKNEKIEQKCKKRFYVSPFMDMNTYYNFKLLNPNEKLSVFIKQTDNSGTVLTATQVGDKKEFSFKQLLINFFKYPLMTFKIISSIHFEAFLLWKKGAIYRGREKKIINNLSYEEN